MTSLGLGLGIMARWSGSRYEPGRRLSAAGPQVREPAGRARSVRSPSPACIWPGGRCWTARPAIGAAARHYPAPAGTSGGGGGRRGEPAVACRTGLLRRAVRRSAAAAERPDRADPRPSCCAPASGPGRHWASIRAQAGHARPFSAFVAFLLVYGLHFGDVPMAYRPLALVVRCCWAFFGPDIYLSNAATKRRHALAEGAARRPGPAGDLRRSRA